MECCCFFFLLLDIVLRLTVKTDGQRGQTVLVLAPFEKPKAFSSRNPVTGTAAQRFWECSGAGLPKSISASVFTCQRIQVKVILRTA